MSSGSAGRDLDVYPPRDDPLDSSPDAVGAVRTLIEELSDVADRTCLL